MCLYFEDTYSFRLPQLLEKFRGQLLFSEVLVSEFLSSLRRRCYVLTLLFSALWQLHVYLLLLQGKILSRLCRRA
jgi:hypothetical protein